ncbi:MAG: hypothetical protein AB1705_22500 [Verrucomicrobiota bacterium]
MPPNDQQLSGLPPGLRAQFVAVEQRLWRKETAIAVCGALCALAISYGGVLLSDRFWDTPVWLRVMLTLAGLGVLGWYVARWGRLWVWRRRDLRAFARLVQHHHRRLGDRLLGVVELADESHQPEGISPALRRAAIRQVSEEAAQYDFSQAVDPRQTRAYALALGALLLPLVLVGIIAPHAVWNAFQRWAAPVSSQARYTFVSLEDLPDRLVVPHGEPFEVVCKVNYLSFWKPQRVRAQIGLQPPMREPVTDGVARVTVPGQTQEGVLRLRVGDAQRDVAVIPTHRPSLRQLAAGIKLPEYLHYPPLEEPVRGNSLNVLAGSEVAFRGKANRALTSIEMRVDRGQPEPLASRDGEFHSTPRKVESPAQVSFQWRDELGLTNAAPQQVTVQTLKDQPPRVELPDLPVDIAILESEVLRIRTVAQDDYGVRELGVAWNYTLPEGAPTSATVREATTNSVSPQDKRLENNFLFSPSVLQIPPDTTVELRGRAVDYLPGRAPAESALHRIHVIGTLQHAEMVRQQFEALFARLEEITRREESINSKTKDLQLLPTEKLAAEEAGKKAGEQADEQAQTARFLEAAAREGMKALREALRNPTFSDETLREWAKNLQGMQSVAKGEMQEAGKSLKSAQQGQNSEQRLQELAKAEKSEQAALDALQQMQQRMNQGLDNLQAQTLAQRLRKLAEDEKQIEGRLQVMVPETIGLLANDLPDRFRRANTDLAENQEQARTDSQDVQTEMSRFFERTKRPNYGEVSKEMQESNTGEKLDQLRGMIASNISMQAMDQLSDWSQRFNAWADRLEPKPEDSGGGGAGQGGKPPMDMSKQLMALLRLRQQEVNLRDRTRLLEKQRAQDANYEGTAKKLSASQFQMRKQVMAMQGENELPLLDEPLEETFLAMRESETVLAKPDTGAPADQAQGKTVDLLTDMINLLNELSQKNNSSQSSAQAEMEFMMQMVAQDTGAMPMRPGAQPGVNRNGGNTDKRPDALSGEAAGDNPEQRGIQRASGTSRTLPVEFREALESYFKAIEQEGR